MCTGTTTDRCVLPDTNHGQSAGNCESGLMGSCSYSCSDGTWTKAYNNCVGCGSTENSCDPGDPSEADDTPKEDGACAVTEADECTAGMFVNKDDQRLENGACASTRDQCTGGNPANGGGITGGYSWDCLGVDQAKLWQCDGIDGAKNWTCTSGSVAKQCAIPIAASDKNCSETTTAATDDSCLICDTGYHKHNGQCKRNPVCDALECADDDCDNWSDNDDGSCEVDAHYRDIGDTDALFKWECRNGNRAESCQGDRPPRNCTGTTTDRCVLPDTNHGQSAGSCESGLMGSCSYSCSDGTWTKAYNNCVRCGSTENSCDPGDPSEADDTPKENGACAVTEADECTAGMFVNKDDQRLENGACASTRDQCTGGNPANGGGITGGYSWDCLGVDQAKLWQCDGIDGAKNWTCTSGSVAKQCAIPIAASDKNCSETTTAATDASCLICNTGYHKHNGRCERNPVCGDLECADGNCNNWSDDDDGSCEVDPDYRDLGDTNAFFKWQCTSGGMTAPCQGDRPPPRNCTISDDAPPETWQVGIYTCTAPARSDTSHGATATVTDSTISSDNPYTGSVSFSCTNGNWGPATGMACECGDECQCVQAGNTWMDAQPERPNTCTGNDACLPNSHRHSCTTRADPNGGYLSCEYSRHRGGILCSSHRTETCNPIPAVTAHCHHDHVCEFCCEFGDQDFCP